MLKYVMMLGVVIGLGACTSEPEEKAQGPEKMLEANKALWAKYADKSYSITFSRWNIDGTTTFECEADKGVIGTCTRTYKCCGEDPEVRTVDGHETPAQILDRLGRDLAKLGYDSSKVDDTSFVVHKTVVEDGDTTDILILASFEPTYGYPKQILYAAGLPGAESITKFQLK